MKKYIYSTVATLISAYVDKDWSWQYLYSAFAVAFIITYHLLILLETKWKQ